jgi:hypothetical protein
MGYEPSITRATSLRHSAQLAHQQQVATLDGAAEIGDRVS